MPGCYLCGDPLNLENRSFEHILPNSIGGRLKSADLLCKTCNEQTGLLFDDVFARFAGIWASKHAISRDRGNVQNLKAKNKVTGAELIVKPGYLLEFAQPQITEQGPYSSLIVANNFKRFYQAVEQLRKKKRDAGLEFELGEITIDPGGEKVEFVIDELFNQDTLLRSVCKTVCNYYYYKTGDRALIGPLIHFLTTGEENRYCWFADLGLVSSHGVKEPLHLLLIRGDHKQKAVYAYFEIFGEKGFVVLVNGRYTGEDFLMRYAFDPLKRAEIPFTHEFSLDVGQMIRMIQAKPGL